MSYFRRLGDVSTAIVPAPASTVTATKASDAFIGLLWLIALVVSAGAVWSALTDEDDDYVD